jgi:hypothetical protein
VCFHLVLASPLTLSEIRAMLPAGLAADPLGSAETRLFQAVWPETQTVARLVHGACSCDLVVQRHPVSLQDEAWLRRRYREQGIPRDQVIRALEGHRRAAGATHRPRPEGHWPRALAAFVVEHARNAGPTGYLLHFAHDGRLSRLPESTPAVRTAAAVRADPGGWLPEGHLIVVDP